jgi:hypothetical protein
MKIKYVNGLEILYSFVLIRNIFTKLHLLFCPYQEIRHKNFIRILYQICHLHHIHKKEHNKSTYTYTIHSCWIINQRMLSINGLLSPHQVIFKSFHFTQADSSFFRGNNFHSLFIVWKKISCNLFSKIYQTKTKFAI